VDQGKPALNRAYDRSHQVNRSQKKEIVATLLKANRRDLAREFVRNTKLTEGSRTRVRADAARNVKQDLQEHVWNPLGELEFGLRDFAKEWVQEDAPKNITTPVEKAKKLVSKISDVLWPLEDRLPKYWKNYEKKFGPVGERLFLKAPK
jgi:hypothetical protein